MPTRPSLLTFLTIVTVLTGIPGHDHGLRGDEQSAAPQHDHNHTPAPDKAAAAAATPKHDMMAEMAKLDGLVQTMNAATGEARTDAMAALLTALVQQHRAMRASMANGMGDGHMQMMMGGMGKAGAPDAPNK